MFAYGLAGHATATTQRLLSGYEGIFEFGRLADGMGNQRSACPKFHLK